MHSTIMSCTTRTDRVNRLLTGTKAAGLYRLECARRWQPDRSTAPGGGRAAGRSIRRRPGCTGRPPRRGRCVLCEPTAGRCRPRPAAGSAPSAGRHDLEQTILPSRRAAMAGRQLDPAATAVAAKSAMPTGAISTMPISSRCRTNGNILGTPLGISPSIRVPLALIDIEFAKQQLVLLCREWYMHPNGQMPAYERQFDDVNPPVHAWATWRIFQMDRQTTRRSRRRSCFP